MAFSKISREKNEAESTYSQKPKKKILHRGGTIHRETPRNLEFQGPRPPVLREGEEEEGVLG